MNDDDLEKYRVTRPIIEESQPEANSTASGIDPAIPQAALGLLRNILRGNGVKPEQITLLDHKIAMIPFGGTLRIKLAPKIAKRHLGGRDTNGELVGDENSMFQHLDHHLHHIMSTPGLRQPVVNIALKRPGSGFGFNADGVAFKSLNKTYVMHQGCVHCHKTGSLPCNLCNGQRQTTCPACNGQREIGCSTCQGRGQNNNQRCPTCQGRGRIPCRTCGGDGLVTCRNCANTGRIRCQRCSGSGWQTLQMLADMAANYRFVLNAPSAPPPLLNRLQQTGTDLVERGAAQLTPSTPVGPESPEGAALKLDRAEAAMTYAGRLPWGPIRFIVAGHEIAATLYGYRGDLLDMPDILERIGAKWIQLLRHAAQEPHQASALLPQAARARFVREAIQAALLSSRPRALAQYHARYPVGLSDAMIRDLLALSETATRHAARGARWAGWAAGQGAALLVAGLYYYLSPGLSLTAHLAPPYGAMGAEAGITVTLMVLAFYAPRWAGARALRRVLGQVITPQYLHRLLPRPGALEWVGIGTIPLIMLGIALLTFPLGLTPPPWLASLIALLKI